MTGTEYVNSFVINVKYQGHNVKHVVPWMGLVDLPGYVLTEIPEYSQATIRDIMITVTGFFDNAGEYSRM